MERKIIGVISFFNLKQIIYVYENENQIEEKQCNLNQIVKNIFELSQKYNINQIFLHGEKHFLNKFVKQIKEKEISKYGKNNLDIIII